MGRGYNYATCLEGALKIKELTYMHSEGILAGELKHGPLALVDKAMPVIMIATRDPVYVVSFIIGYLFKWGTNRLLTVRLEMHECPTTSNGAWRPPYLGLREGWLGNTEIRFKVYRSASHGRLPSSKNIISSFDSGNLTKFFFKYLIKGILTVIPMQLLSYHIAVLRGCNVDCPRNLAKSVTVEWIMTTSYDCFGFWFVRVLLGSIFICRFCGLSYRFMDGNGRCW